MSRKKVHSKAALIFVLLLSPLVAYAVWLMALFLLDNLRGDGLMLYQYAFESRRRLALQLLSDARHALPVFYAVTVLYWLVLSLLTRFRPMGGILAAIIAGVLMGLIGAALLLGMSWGAVVPAVAAGSLLALVLHAAKRSSPVPR